MDIYKKIFEFVGSTYQPKENRDELYSHLKKYIEVSKLVKKLKKNSSDLVELMIKNNISYISFRCIYDKYDDCGYLNNICIYNEKKEIIEDEIKDKILDYCECNFELVLVKYYSLNENNMVHINEIENDFITNTIKKTNLDFFNQVENYEKNLLNESIKVDKNKINNSKIKKV